MYSLSVGSRKARQLEMLASFHTSRDIFWYKVRSKYPLTSLAAYNYSAARSSQIIDYLKSAELGSGFRLMECMFIQNEPPGVGRGYSLCAIHLSPKVSVVRSVHLPLVWCGRCILCITARSRSHLARAMSPFEVPQHTLSVNAVTLPPG